MSNWLEMKDQRGPDGLLTPLALALDAIEDNGCDCENWDDKDCLAHLCEAALRDLWEETERHASLLSWLDVEIEAARDRENYLPEAGVSLTAFECVKARLAR